MSTHIRIKSSYLETSGTFHTAAFFLKTSVLVDPFKNTADKNIMCQCFRRALKALMSQYKQSPTRFYESGSVNK